MLTPLLDLAGNLSWNSIFKRTIEAVDGPYPNTFNPIPDQTAICSSNIVLVGCKSPRQIPPTWKIGCWASLNLGILPDSQTQLLPIVQISRKAIPLDSLILFHEPKYQPQPYYLRLEIPYWIESIYIEAWAYDGEQSTEERQILESLI